VGWSYFGTDGKPCLHKDRYHRSEARYDERGNEVEWTCFGVDEQPCTHKDGYHMLTKLYDPRGRKREETGFGPSGSRTVVRQYDEGKIRLATWHTDETARRRFGPHAAQRRQEFDEDGRVVQERFTDAAAVPVQTAAGYSRFQVEYDPEGPPRRLYFDKAGQAVPTQVRVQGIEPGSRGEKLRLQTGDVLVRYDGKPVTQAEAFEWQHKEEASPARPRPLVLRRNGKEEIVSLPPGPHGLDLLDVAKPPAEPSP
jgi:hypothetical protein